MQASFLQLETYFIERLQWALLEDFDPTAETALHTLVVDDLQFNLERSDIEAPRHAAYRLTLGQNPQPAKYPYAWEIVLVGYFRLDKGIPEEQVIAIMDGNAPAVLYGAAREALATTLCRGPFRAPILPGVNFMNLQRAPEEKEPTKKVTKQKSPNIKKRKAAKNDI